MRKPNYRLSTDEVERLVKEETERRRKLRIVQVREQAKANAALIRDKVKSEKERLLQQFADEVKNELEAEKAEKLRKLELKYDNSLRTVGQGHREVHVQGDGQNIAGQRFRQQRANRNTAEERFKVAVEKQSREKAMQEWEETRGIRNRKLALEVEKDRAAAVAALPPPPPDISAELERIQKKAIPMTDMKAFATTHFHIPDFQVVKAGPEEQTYDAKALAQESDLLLKQDLAEKKRSHHEQIERARIRGNEALQREMLKHDLGDMLQDLSLLQRKDRRRRQALVSDVPKQVFIPPERCLEERADREVEMERKFEEIYVKQNKSDSGTSQVWSEQPSAVPESTEISTTVDSAPIGGPASRGIEINPALRDVTNLAKTAPSKTPDTILKQLLNKIKEQRNNAITSQKLPVASASANAMPASDVDAHSVMSVESRASWKKTVDDEELAVDSSRLPSGAQLEPDKAAAAPLDEVDKGRESSSGVDGATLTKTNDMIEELQQRIKVIEEQKLQLSQQLQLQSDFYKKFQQFQQQHSRQSQQLSPSSKDNGNLSLEEVSLNSSQKEDLEASESRASKASPGGHRQMPPNEDSRGVDLSSAASNLRPVFGILKGRKNPSYELLTSNGFLPLPEMDQTDDHSGQGDNARSLLPIFEAGVTSEPANHERDDSFRSDEQKDKEKERGARRMIDFRQLPAGSSVSLKAPEFYHPQSTELSGRMDHSGSSNPYLLEATGSTLSHDDEMGKRLKDYQLRAQHIQSSLNMDTLTKVREYQSRLLQNHEDRKQFLSDIRADIERRREALYSTRFSTGLESHLMNLGTTSTHPHVETRMNDDGQRGMESYQALKPIAPFIADPWIKRSGGNREDGMRSEGQRYTASTSKELEVGDKGDVMDQDDGSVSRHRGEEISGLDRIRRSLPFDDLNDSNFDTALMRDNLLNDSATPKSTALSEDSRLMSSEEERGSPILTGSRSDRFDTSDKSNNSVTGSSSLNGSALVARAEERREGFERKQEELRRQLTEIQDQKEAILQRYYKGQQALQQQQESLKAKIASSVPSYEVHPMTVDFQQRAELRKKLSDIRSQVEPEYKTDDVSRKGSFLIGTQVSGQTGGTVNTISPINWSEHLRQFQSESNGKLSQTHNSNILSYDSYLDDISYHQIKGSEEQPDIHKNSQRYLSNSSPEERRFIEGESQDNLGAVRNDEDASSSLQTWATVLKYTQGAQTDDEDKVGGSFGSLSEEAASGSKTPPIVSRVGVYEHQPHELSTILEVDTPTTSSVVGSTIRPVASTLSNPSLSHGSTLSLISRWDSDVRVDRFPEPPYTFPTSSMATGAAYDLSSGTELKDGGFGLPKEPRSGITLTETSKAARSLHFHPPEIEIGGLEELESTQSPGVSFHSEAVTVEGDDFSLRSQSLPAADDNDKDLSLESRSLSPDQVDGIVEMDLPEFIPSLSEELREVHVSAGQEELSSMAMPDLVGLTPIKPFYDGAGEKNEGV